MMIVMVKFTEKSGKPIYVQPCNVTIVRVMDDPAFTDDVKGMTEICTQSERVLVKESIENVVKLLEYGRSEV